MSNSNATNSEIIKLKKKLKKYDEVLRTLAVDEGDDNDKELYKSVLVYNPVDGQDKKMLPTELGESFLVLDEGKDLDELNKNEQNAIEQQTYLSRADRTKRYLRQLNNSYGWVCTVFGVTKIMAAVLL